MTAASQDLRLEDGTISTADGHSVLRDVPPSLQSVRLDGILNGIVLGVSACTASSCHDTQLGQVIFRCMFGM